MTGELRAKGSAHVIVLGNEKGGSGKTTTAMHVIAHLLHAGYRVGSIDLDGRQRSLTRYVENRRIWADAANVNLVMPEHAVIMRSSLGTVTEASDNNLSRLGHARADTLITPMNDSFVDFDLLGRVDPQTYRVKGPSVYSEMVWECRKRRAVSDGGEIDWIVIRNRLSHVDAKNKRRVEAVLDALAQRIGFRCGPGFGERVVFREMFPSGLTLLDLREEGVDAQMSMSHVAARAEVRALTEALALPVLPGAGA
jgi:chromosome partitioning protein